MVGVRRLCLHRGFHAQGTTSRLAWLFLVLYVAKDLKTMQSSQVFGFSPSSVACIFHTRRVCQLRVTFLFLPSSNFFIQITLNVSTFLHNLPLAGIHSFIHLTFYFESSTCATPHSSLCCSQLAWPMPSLEGNKAVAATTTRTVRARMLKVKTDKARMARTTTTRMVRVLVTMLL